MQWVLITKDKLSALTRLLYSNGFHVYTQLSDHFYYCIVVPDHYDIQEFVRKIPIKNDFLITGNIIRIIC